MTNKTPLNIPLRVKCRKEKISQSLKSNSSHEASIQYVLSRAIAHKKHLLDCLLEDTKDVNSDLSWGKESSCDGTEAAATAVEIKSCFLDDNMRPQWGDQKEAEYKACVSWCKLLLVTSVSKCQ